MPSSAAASWIGICTRVSPSSTERAAAAVGESERAAISPAPPGAGWRPARGSRPRGIARDRRGCAGGAAAAPAWPSGRRSWGGRAGGRRPPPTADGLASSANAEHPGGASEDLTLDARGPGALQRLPVPLCQNLAPRALRDLLRGHPVSSIALRGFVRSGEIILGS